jgi:uncharacterized membrane protein (UPF0127 family)
MILKHNGKTLASQVVFAKNIFSQMSGLMFRKNISQEFAMIFMFKKPMTLGVHMLFMRFPIDAIFLDGEKKIVGIETLRPWVGHKRMKGVKYLIEMHKGIAAQFGLKIGDIIRFD